MNFDEYEEQCEYIEFGGQRWKWPKKDEKLKQVNDWVNDLDTVLFLMTKAEREMGVAIQAGGACGIWPVELAKHFGYVYTFEPDPLNYWCLSANVSAYPEKIFPCNFALGENPGTVTTQLHPSESNNVGAYYTADARKGVPRIRIDGMNLKCDLLCLDIEGREVEALRGAYNTIEINQPYIMIEEKALPQMGKGKPVSHTKGEASEWLIKTHGYKLVKEVHRDLIFEPPK